MLARLGQVLYWGFSGIATAILGLTIWYQATRSYGFVWDELGMAAAIALVVWLIGRACKYVLAGK